MTSFETALFISWQGLIICAVVTIGYNYMVRGFKSLTQVFLKNNRERKPLH
jgi:hypothetical protein